MKLRGKFVGTGWGPFAGTSVLRMDSGQDLKLPGDVSAEFTPGQEVEVSVTAVGRAAEPCMACKGKGGQYVGNVAGGVAHFDPCQYCRGTGRSVTAVGAEAAGEVRPAPQPCVNSCRFVLQGADWCGPCRDAHASQGKQRP